MMVRVTHSLRAPYLLDRTNTNEPAPWPHTRVLTQSLKSVVSQVGGVPRNWIELVYLEVNDHAAEVGGFVIFTQ